MPLPAGTVSPPAGQIPVRTTPAPIEFAMPAPKRPIALPRHLGCLVKMIFGFGVLLLMGYFALIALNPKAREWATKGAKDGSGGPTPFNTVNQILAIPAQAIGKTKDVVAAGDARVGVLDGVIAEEEGKKKKKGAAATHVVTDPFATSPAPAGPGVSAARALLTPAPAGAGEVAKGSVTTWAAAPCFFFLPSSSAMTPSSTPTRASPAATTSLVLPMAWAGMARIWFIDLKGVGPPLPSLAPWVAHSRALGFSAIRAK